MLYAILCHDSEAVIGAMTKQEDDELPARVVAWFDCGSGGR